MNSWLKALARVCGQSNRPACRSFIAVSRCLHPKIATTAAVRAGTELGRWTNGFLAEREGFSKTASIHQYYQALMQFGEVEPYDLPYEFLILKGLPTVYIYGFEITIYRHLIFDGI
jgi:hypothetical protein